MGPPGAYGHRLVVPLYAHCGPGQQTAPPQLSGTQCIAQFLPTHDTREAQLRKPRQRMSLEPTPCTPPAHADWPAQSIPQVWVELMHATPPAHARTPVHVRSHWSVLHATRICQLTCPAHATLALMLA